MDDRNKNSFDLTLSEQSVLGSFNQTALECKSRILDLQDSLERARAELHDIDRQFNGAIILIANNHGLAQAQVSPDLKRITGSKPN